MSRAAAWKFEIARELIAVVVPIVEVKAPLVPASAQWPHATRSATLAGLKVMVGYDVKQLHTQLRGRTTIDIWLPEHGGKVFFAAWEPLEVNRLDRGAWIQDLLTLTEGRVLQ